MKHVVAQLSDLGACDALSPAMTREIYSLFDPLGFPGIENSRY
jgi:hypothetical protein